MLEREEIEEFRKTIWDFYNTHGRVLPWRETADPYKILVSEMMLQQTQVVRVLPKYDAFLKAFPTVQSLAQATMQEVLTLWIGLGYNRRARYLHQAAQKVVSEYDGIFSRVSLELQALPGIGPYTASAVSTFGYNNREVLIETNIRTVFIHHFFKDKEGITDADILLLIEQTLPVQEKGQKDIYKNWYWALMDYGSYLKETMPNPSRKSKHHTKQSKFKGSLREARGLIVRVLSTGPHGEARLSYLAQEQGIESGRLKKALEGLVKESMIEERDGTWNIL